MAAPTLLLTLLACSMPHAAPFAVAIVSPRAGLTFTDSEPVDVRAKVSGATEQAVVRYTVSETAGPWKAEGEVRIQPGADGTGEARLPLHFPGRELYTLALDARCGGQEAKVERSLGIVFPPPPVSAASPWGIFYIPMTWPGKSRMEGYRDIARNIRLLGASWVRFNFWAHTFGKITITPGPNPTVTADWSQAREMVRALREQGLFIMGEVAQCPRELSSRPNDTKVSGDAGPVYNRVKPANYALWEQLMAKLAHDFRDDIQVWEIWNEPNWPNGYWTGTVEDFAQLVKNTAAGLRRGNPQAKIAAGGFVGGQAFADKCFSLGMGKAIDVLTVHYTDVNPRWIDQWKALLKKYNLHLPIWNSEELSEVPVRNMAGGIVRTFKFCHINIGYPGSRLLVNKDLTPRAPAILYSVGVHCLNGARWVRRSGKVPSYDVHFFRRGDEEIAAFTPFGAAGKLFVAAREVTLKVTPLRAGEPVVVTDSLGRSTPLAIRDGEAKLSLSGTEFINGAREIHIVSAKAGVPRGVVVAEAEDGTHSAGWNVNSHDGFSEGKTLDIWSDDEPGPEGYWVEVKLRVPEARRYDVLFSGNSLARLAAPRSLSPFEWQMDGGKEHLADKALPVIHNVPGAPQGLSELGTAELAAGEHTFRLRLTGRRDKPDKYYALWFDAIALRKK